MTTKTLIESIENGAAINFEVCPVQSLNMIAIKLSFNVSQSQMATERRFSLVNNFQE